MNADKRIAELEEELEKAREEIEADDYILKGCKELLDAIPECPAHGPCIPHAVKWIAEARADKRRIAALEELVPHISSEVVYVIGIQKDEKGYWTVYAEVGMEIDELGIGETLGEAIDAAVRKKEKVDWRVKVGGRKEHWIEAAELICLRCKQDGAPEISGDSSRISYRHGNENCKASGIWDELAQGDL